MPNKTSCLLTSSELLDIYGVPIFNDVERREYFTLNAEEIKALNKFKSTEKGIYFSVCLVYFKIKKTFVSFRYQDITEDRRYIMARFFPDMLTPRTLPKSTNTIARIEKSVLALCDYTRLVTSQLEQIKSELQAHAMSKPKQRELFKSLLDLLTKYRVATPGITTLQNIVSEVWSKENNRIIKTYKRHTNKKQRATILSLLNKPDFFHNITNIRQDMKGFRTHELHQEIEKHSNIIAIFSIAKVVLPKLRLPSTTIDYFANLINYYTGSRLKNINTHIAQLYLLCYCYTRYQRLNDNLLESLKKRTTDHQNSAKKYAKEQALKQLDIVKDIRQKVSKMLMAIKHQPGHQVSKKMLYKHLPANEWVTAATLLGDDKFDKDILFWQYIDPGSNTKCNTPISS